MASKAGTSSIPDSADSCSFQIAGVGLRLACQRDIKATDPFRPFLKNSLGEPLWRAEFIPTRALPHCSDELAFRGNEYAVFSSAKGEECRLFFDRKDDGKPYAVSFSNNSDRSVKVFYLADKWEYVCETGNCMFHIGWERILMLEGRMVLHASCVETEYGGILFSGPSGIGKSTQADLWQRYTGASLVNGDRTILYRAADGWMGCGSPYAGSSRCYRNAEVPVRAIVMLSQAESCSIRRMAPREAFVRLYAGTTVNDWDSEFVNRISDMLMSLISEIPVYALACTPDENAVRILAEQLSEGVTT